jgi:tetratricopeptide (TPR) repeat protein
LRLPIESSVRVPYAVEKRTPQQKFPPAPAFSPAIADSPTPDILTGPVPTASPEDLYEVALTAAAMSYDTVAIKALRDCTAIAPNHGPAWHKLAALLRLANEDADAAAAEAAAQCSSGVSWRRGADSRSLPELQKAERELVEPLKSQPEDEAATVLREHLMSDPLDAVAMRFLARIEELGGDWTTARTLYERALDICPVYTGAREEYCRLLEKLRDFSAIAETKRLLDEAPDHPHYRFLYANALIDNDKVEAAIGVLTGLLHQFPNDVQFWVLYGHALRMTGRREEAVQAYRKCLEVQPDMGFAWWGLAELKDKVLTEDDVAEMRVRLEEHALPSESRMAIHYALGQTLERAGDFKASFAAYEEGAREHQAIKEIRKIEANEHSSAESIENSRTGDNAVSAARRIREVFSRENFGSRLRRGPVVSPDTPIFVIGMPRSGSTLVEQILASHSRAEGIGERPLVGDIKRGLARSRMLVTPDAYPECLFDLGPDGLAALGAKLIADSRKFRTTDRPFFVDKRVWSWQDVGLIHLILPQAKIIDIRREPLAACFAMYKQMLPRESCDFSYDFKELGPYYNQYVSLMKHWHAVLPGRVHFVQYERLVEDTEGEIRRMLEYCGLPFEEGCLRFWEADRAIVTPSAEQVRRPIYRHALEQWRNFEPWLGPLKEALAAPVES